MFELPHYFYKLHIYNTCGARLKKKQKEEINRVRVWKIHTKMYKIINQTMKNYCKKYRLASKT